MGTVMAHKAYGLYTEECLTAVRREIARLEGLLSRFLPGSDVSRINESAGISGETVSRETYVVLTKASEFSRSCPGCFDVTIEPLVRLWQRSRADAAQPEAGDIQHALSLVDYRDLVLDPGDRCPFQRSAGLRYEGQAIDLGGIGKGYAGDRILEVYQEYEITSAYSNLGGNVVTVGGKPDGSPWQIGIQHPRDEKRILGAVSAANQTVVTSGDYQRYYTDRQGLRRHHILDPKTGCPAEAGLISVTIVAEKSITADALSTIIFVAGIEKGLEYLQHFQHTDAILVDADLRVFVTPGLRGRFQADQGVAVTVLK
jgi:thiamine biosynthesis lipoprotein